MAGRFQAGVGDQQDARAAQLARELAQPGQRARPEHDAVERGEVKRRRHGGGPVRDACCIGVESWLTSCRWPSFDQTPDEPRTHFDGPGVSAFTGIGPRAGTPGRGTGNRQYSLRAAAASSA